MSNYDNRMSDPNSENERKQAAAANLEKRRQQLREEKKQQKRRSAGPAQTFRSGSAGLSTRSGSASQTSKSGSAGLASADDETVRKILAAKKRKKKELRLRIFIIIGLILIACLLFMIAKKGIAHIAERAEKAKAEREAAAAAADKVVIGLKGSQVQLVLQGEPYIENGAFAIDTAEGAIPESEIKVKGKVDTAEPGEYTVKYTAKGASGKASAERTVRVLTDEEYGDKAGNVPVMMYHWIYTANDVPEDLDGNWILDTTLEEHLSWLKENEFYYPGWKELRAWIDGKISLPSKVTVLTFDDGKEAFLKYGIPLFEKYQIPVTSFMIGWEKNKGAKKIKMYTSPYLDYESHTYAMHQKVEPLVDGHKGIMASMSKDEIKADLTKAAELTGSNDAMAYPYGDYTDDMLEAVREQNILCAFTVEYDRVRQGMDPAKLPRIRVMGDESFQTWKDSVY